MWPECIQTSYLDMFIRDSIPKRNRKYGHNKNVLHHETCPCCGRKLVNLYLGDVKKIAEYHGEAVVKIEKEWKCKACWDKEKGEST